MESLRVLVVDDEPGMRLGVERVLRNFSVSLPEIEGDVHFEISQAETGEEALELIDSFSPAILLLDNKLPGISGLDVLEQIAGRDGDMLTVMISAYASLDVAITATKQGAFDFLAKPFTPEEIKNVVGKAARHLMLRREARRLAEEKKRLRFEFISVLAHELKAPLSVVESYLQIIADKTAGDDPEAYEKMVSRSIIRLAGMRKMIKDILDLTYIESGQKKRDFIELDLKSIAEDTIEAFTPVAAETDVTLTLQCDKPVTMIGDRGEIDIVLNNLVSNAIKYNRQGGQVTVVLDQAEGEVVLAVTDTGIGMSEQEVAKLFGEFVRIKNKKTQNILGSGLGLSIVKKIAQIYGGDIKAVSEPDVGTTFTVTLRSQAQAEANEAD